MARVQRHPYGSSADDLPYSREALIDALDAPAVTPRRSPAPPAGRAPQRVPGGPAVPAGVPPATGARVPSARRESVYSGDVVDAQRRPSTSRPLEYFSDPANAQLTGAEEREAEGDDPYTLPPETPAPTGTSDTNELAPELVLAPGTPTVAGAVARETFRPGAGAVGDASSYFENLVSYDTSYEGAGVGYNPRESAREYDGGKQAPMPDQLSPQRQAMIRGHYGLDPNGLSQENVNELVAQGWIYGDRAPDGYSYNDDGLLKKDGSVLKTIGRIATIAAPVIATIATGGAMSPWLAATIGAGAGGANAALSGGDVSDVLTGAALGGATAGIPAAGRAAGWTTGQQALAGAGVGAAGGALTGGGVPGALIGGGLGAASGALGGGAPATTGQALTTAGIEAGLLGLEGVMAPDDIGTVDPETGQTVTGATPEEEGAPVEGEEGPETPEAASAALGAPVAPMEGFNLDREQDPSFSVKDAFAAAVRNPDIPPPPGEDKAALGDWFAEHVAPAIEAQGHTINWVDGDKVNITGPQGTGTIDWYRGAGAPGGALAWQPEGGGDDGGAFQGSGATTLQDGFSALQGMVGPDASIEDMEAAITAAFADVPGFEDAYKESVKIDGQWYDLVGSYGGANPTWQLMPKNDGAGATTTGGVGGLTGGGAGLAGYSNLAPGVSLAAPLGRSDVLEQIMEEIRRLQSGAPPRDALLAELGAE